MIKNKFLQPPRCNDQILVSTNSIDDEKHIEEELQNDQLLYTTAGPLATSNTVRIVQTVPPDTVISSSSSSGNSSNTDTPITPDTLPSISSFTDHVTATIKLTNESISRQNKFLSYQKGQIDSNTEFATELEGLFYYLLLIYFYH